MKTPCSAEKHDETGLPWLCTLEKGHAGPHEAWGAGSKPYEVWGQLIELKPKRRDEDENYKER